MRTRMLAHTYVYNKVKRKIFVIQVFIYVKSRRKTKLFFRNIWQFRKIVVLLHSLLRNTVSLSDKRKSSLKDFT